MKKRKNSKKIALTEVILLIASIFAFSYMLGSSIPIVGAQDPFSEIPFLPASDKIIEVPGIGEGIASQLAKAVEEANLPSPTPIGAVERYLNYVFSPGVSSGIASILGAVGWASAAYFAAKWAAQQFGASSGQAKAVAAGAATTVFLGAGGAAGISKILGLGAVSGPLGWIIGGVLGLLITAFSWKDEKKETVVFTCDLWQPQAGGKNCEKCNTGLIPCTEYQCKSLGASCKIENKGTKEQKCVWYNRMDTVPPIISPWEEALKPNYRYNNNNLAFPPNRGFNVTYLESKDGCIPAYTPLNFGVKVDKNAKCSVDLFRKKNFSSMLYSLSSGQYLKEHSIELRMPSTEDLEKEGVIPIGSIGNSHKLFVKCLSTNGVESKADLEFSYCIQKGPDLSPPQIVETSIANNSPVSFGTSSVDLTVSIDKPGQCKWSTLDRTYGDMENTMTCATDATKFSAKMLYDCKTSLTGIKDRVNNDFYFRCNGTYNGIANPSSYLFRLKGTEPLVITKVGPNETIKDSTEPIKVTLTAETASGADNGKSICSYMKVGSEEDYIAFYNTNSYTHSQELNVYGGDYNYSIRCVDAGGNADTKFTNFKVEIDKTPPAVVRAFHDGNDLKIITNEEAECVYDISSCKYYFEDGIKMTDDEKEHVVAWDTYNEFHIKCMDKYGNRPAFDICSIEVRPFNLA
jgi:hypothetical protein